MSLEAPKGMVEAGTEPRRNWIGHKVILLHLICYAHTGGCHAASPSV